MRVAVFKRFPAASAFYLHPFRRAVEGSRAVDAVEYYLRPAIARHPRAAALDRAVAARLLRGPTHAYERMGAPEVVADLHARRFDIVVPDGHSIVTAPFLATARVGVLMFHYGPLPSMRGMNTVEWCLLLGRTPGTTLYFYDAGIDTGDIVFTADVAGPFRSIRAARRAAHRTSLALFSRFFADVAAGLAARRPQSLADGVTYYVMHPALKAALDARLSGARPAADRARTALGRLHALLAGAPEAGGAAAPGGAAGPPDLLPVLRALRAPAQEDASGHPDRVVTALHFLHKRRAADPTLARAAGAALAGLLRARDPGAALAWRLANELWFLLDPALPAACRHGVFTPEARAVARRALDAAADGRAGAPA